MAHRKGRLVRLCTEALQDELQELHGACQAMRSSNQVLHLVHKPLQYLISPMRTLFITGTSRLVLQTYCPLNQLDTFMLIP